MEDIKYITEAITEHTTDVLNDALSLDNTNDIKCAIEMAICDLKRLKELINIHIKYNKMDELCDNINGEK